MKPQAPDRNGRQRREVTGQQQAAVDLLAAGKTDKEATQTLDLPAAAVSKWRLHDPVFQAALNARRAARVAPPEVCKVLATLGFKQQQVGPLEVFDAEPTALNDEAIYGALAFAQRVLEICDQLALPPKELVRALGEAIEPWSKRVVVNPYWRKMARRCRKKAAKNGK
jgi:hypothetical protein